MDPLIVQSWRRFGLIILGWSLLWIVPLSALIKLALRYDLHSHTLLVPFVSAYLIWTDRRLCPQPDPLARLPTLFLGLATVGFSVTGLTSLGPSAADERLAFQLLAFVSGVGLWTSVFLGRAILLFAAFPLAFLIFLVPLPDSLVQVFETALQYGSAEVADWIFIGAGTPSIRDGRFFRLPGLSIEVAQECSGFRSTLVLFMVGLLAARLFLKTGWKRVLLVLTIIPLGLLRNAFRIFTLATLSIEIDPSIMHSALHKRGGPLFFALALIPLNLLLWGLYRSERKRRNPSNPLTPPIHS